MKEPLSAARWLLAIAVGCLFTWLLAAALGAFVENVSLPAQEYASRVHRLAIPFWASWAATALVAAIFGFVVGKLFAAAKGSISKPGFAALAAAALATLLFPELFTSGTTPSVSVLLALPHLAVGLAGLFLGSRAVRSTANAA